MTPGELAAYHAGLQHAADMALISALTIELRADAGEVRQRAAIEALRGLAEGLKAEARPEIPANGLPATMAAIAADPESAGVAACPECSGRLVWIKDASNGHIHARCEGSGCVAIMQ